MKFRASYTKWVTAEFKHIMADISRLYPNDGRTELLIREVCADRGWRTSDQFTVNHEFTLDNIKRLLADWPTIKGLNIRVRRHDSQDDSMYTDNHPDYYLRLDRFAGLAPIWFPRLMRSVELLLNLAFQPLAFRWSGIGGIHGYVRF